VCGCFAEKHRVEVHVALREHRFRVPVRVTERLEEAVRDEGGVVRVVIVERVVEVVAAGDGDVIEPVEGGVADDGRIVAEPGREPQPFEQVEPLAAPRRLVVSDHGEEGYPASSSRRRIEIVPIRSVSSGRRS